MPRPARTRGPPVLLLLTMVSAPARTTARPHPPPHRPAARPTAGNLAPGLRSRTYSSDPGARAALKTPS